MGMDESMTKQETKEMMEQLEKVFMPMLFILEQR